METSLRYWSKRHLGTDNHCSFYGRAYHYELRRMVVRIIGDGVSSGFDYENFWSTIRREWQKTKSQSKKARENDPMQSSTI